MLEQVVRPFQRPQTIATQRIVATGEKVEVGTAIISWGQAGTLPGAEEVEEIEEDPVQTAFEVIDCDDEYEELDRNEETVRITQIDEAGNEVAENFVDVKRPKEISFEKLTEKKPYDKTTTWTTAVETANFSTTDINDKKCKATYKLKIEIPAA